MSGSFSSGVSASVIGNSDSASSLGYSTSLKGVGGSGAVGSVSSYFNTHSQEAVLQQNGDGSYSVGLGSDIQYSSSASADGIITSFSTDYRTVF
jgi:hypothetical protein